MNNKQRREILEQVTNIASERATIHAIRKTMKEIEYIFDHPKGE